ncbi:SpaH/EbpB family LPXTG-anchored major pilin [Flaviflexus equikiangi]|uniref:SpaH/EbpB family LPXTG-anchored major pilin n=1 Tax=Flaviflexus equikiangi TaxID=2758573 RepID=A0ABS2TJJ9_9ACTO|nr:SpaH/EbpB family LPXTG-anchored major pilin [Flaviflexus equikiangi]MBM9433952.1 SpaH/EbpB family LPXTG-anchored major pilin [Flaviflexus equikiangi]
MNIKKRGRSALAGLVAAGAAFALALGGGAVANAASGDADSPLILPGTGGAPITGTVTVHKHEQPDTAGDAANGLPQAVTSPTIAGVEFTAQQVESVLVDAETVTFDLTTNKGWQNASKLDYNAATNSWTYEDVAVTSVAFGSKVVRTTGTSGAYAPAVFADLPVGLYHFAETAYPANVTPSVPWVMTVPLTHPTDLNKWLYDINVYPKNSTTNIEKTVEDSAGVKIGDPVTWTIKADIPRTANPGFTGGDPSADNLEFLAPSKYLITDQLDARLALQTVTVSLIGVTGVTLDAGDYTVLPNPIPGLGSNLGQNVQVDFTPAGLAKLGLAGSTAGAQVQVVIGTTVASMGTGETAGIIQNKAILFPNKSTVEGIPSDIVESKWGDILIKKVDASNNTVLVEGAVFSVFVSKEAAEAGTDPIAIGSGGTTKFTTGANGEVRISGLRYSAWADGKELTEDDPDYRTYWLVEVKSPAGYELLAEPVEVIVDSADTLVDVTQIENAPANGGFELPLTGGMGTGVLTLAGISILAAVMLEARSRRDSELAAE